MPSSRHVSVLAGVVGCCLVLAACGGSAANRGSSTQRPSPGGASSAAGGDLQWGSCRRSYQGHYQCATLQVPLNHAAPSGPKISIALIRTKATGKASQRIGSLVLNPGGPGGSAVADWDFLSGQVDSALHQRFDVVGFDPRGVGDSTAVRCSDSAGLDAYTALDLSPTSPQAIAALAAGAKRLAAGCVAKAGALLPYVGTKDAAKDMEDIRRAVGDPKLTYLGFSYGTFLGAEYAQEFPTHVRALVLDGALNPATPPVQATDLQSQGFQRQLDRFLADCKGRGNCGWKIDGDPHAALRALVAGVDATPLPAGHGRELHAGELFYGVGVALYDQRSWPRLATALGAVAKGDGTPMLALSDLYTERDSGGAYTNSIEANVAINCRDYAWPRDPAAFLASARNARSVAPDFGVDNMNLTLACAYFPAADSGAPIPPFTAPGSPPILVIATTGDPATPYDEGVALAKQLSRGVLLTNVGEQHTAYGYSACTRKAADSYLVDLTPPPAGARCDDE